MERFACLAIGYLFGLFQTGYIYGRLHGIDIRNYGSGNAGSTNIARTLGDGAGIITFFGDAFKCVFAVLLVRALFGKIYADILPLLCLYTGAGVILGHDFPFYLKFHGGKGVAAMGGLLLSFHLPMTGLGLVTFLAVFFLTHYVSLGSLFVYTGFLIEIIIFGQCGAFGMTQRYLNELYVLAAALTALAFWMHRENIRRLCRGEERKTWLFHKKNDENTKKR